MTTPISRTYGWPGKPGGVEVLYLQGLSRGYRIDLSVGAPGEGGKGGPPSANDSGDSAFRDRGGAGGGRENTPIIEALTMYANSLNETDLKPLIFSEPGEYSIEWPYDTETATLVVIGPGGGGGGGMGDILPGEDGEAGLPGAAFIFPTSVPAQRPATS